jgi:hypothetical protein
MAKLLLLRTKEKIMAKIYIVDLSTEEKEELLELTSPGQAPARKMKRAQILLLADEGKKDDTIAEMLHVRRATVERIRKRFVPGRARRSHQRPDSTSWPAQAEPQRGSGVGTAGQE